MLKCPHSGADDFFETFKTLIQGADAKPATRVSEAIIDKGYFDAFYQEIFATENKTIQVGRPQHQRQDFTSIVSDNYDFLASQKSPKKCSNNYFLTGNESEDLLEIFQVLYFDQVKYARVPNRSIPDFHLNTLLKFDSVDKYRLVFGEEDHEEPEQAILENQSFVSLANNPSFVCLDEVGQNQPGGSLPVEVYFITGNEGNLKVNFMNEIENIFKGNSRYGNYNCNRQNRLQNTEK